MRSKRMPPRTPAAPPAGDLDVVGCLGLVLVAIGLLAFVAAIAWGVVR